MQNWEKMKLTRYKNMHHKFYFVFVEGKMLAIGRRSVYFIVNVLVLALTRNPTVLNCSNSGQFSALEPFGVTVTF